MADRKPPSSTDRFLSRVEMPDDPGECWRWTGPLDRYGYGRYSHRGAHRMAYKLLVGPIPEGLVIDHLCRNRACVNPAHLEPVTNAENLRRGAGLPSSLPGGAERRGRWRPVGDDGVPICANGHRLTPDNAAPRQSAPHQLMCRACAADRRRRSEARRAS